MKIRRVDFSPDEWLGGTIGLDNAERGLYITACALIYSAGGPIARDHLRAACSQDHGHAFNRQLNRLLDLGKLSINDGQISNKRAINELEKAAKRAVNAQQNAAKRWNNNDVSDAVALQDGNANHQPSTINHQPSKNISSDRKRSDATDDRFLEFYQVFPKHEARRAAERAWKGACKRASPETIIAGAERYAELMADVEKRFIKQPATWLNADCWADGEEDGRGREHVEVSDEEREAALQQLLKEREGERLYVAYDAGEVGVARG